MKVFYLTNIRSPYRVDFFNELGKYCDLTVLFERPDAKNRKKEWLRLDSSNYKALILRGIAFGSESSISIEVLKYLKRDEYDIFIIGGYSTLTAMIAIEYLNIKKIPFVLNADGGFIKREPT